MQQLLAPLNTMRHLLRDQPSINGQETQPKTQRQAQQQENILDPTSQGSLHPSSATPVGQRRRQHEAASRGPRKQTSGPRLPEFLTKPRRTEAPPKRTAPKAPRRQALVSDVAVISLTVISIITAQIVLSIPAPPPLPQTYDLPSQEA